MRLVCGDIENIKTASSHNMKDATTVVFSGEIESLITSHGMT